MVLWLAVLPGLIVVALLWSVVKDSPTRKAKPEKWNKAARIYSGVESFTVLTIAAITLSSMSEAFILIGAEDVGGKTQ